MEPQELQSKRWIVGLLSLSFLTAFVVLWLMDDSKQAVLGAMIRVGTMLGAFWLAIPVMVRHPKILKRLPWYLLLAMVMLIAFIKQFVLIIPLFIALALLTMFAGRKPPQ
ncbi:hypothetical protein [uncultured Rubinisphaera sp.]|uniref:hypothetical protein n=1 Tax=uncultured Rubinisphaera sp. TaxID=1678686 RepID=UPI0030DC1922